jgi:hypothetical protein
MSVDTKKLRETVHCPGCGRDFRVLRANGYFARYPAARDPEEAPQTIVATTACALRPSKREGRSERDYSRAMLRMLRRLL